MQLKIIQKDKIQMISIQKSQKKVILNIILLKELNQKIEELYQVKVLVKILKNKMTHIMVMIKKKEIKIMGKIKNMT